MPDARSKNQVGRPPIAKNAKLVQARVPEKVHAKLAKEAAKRSRIEKRNVSVAEVMRDKLAQ